MHAARHQRAAHSDAVRPEDVVLDRVAERKHALAGAPERIEAGCVDRPMRLAVIENLTAKLLVAPIAWRASSPAETKRSNNSVPNPIRRIRSRL
jgi:hypothetical protein